MAIISAFETSPIHRLKTMWDSKNGGVSALCIEKLQKLQSVLAVGNNMTTYREFFKLLPPPKIPFLG